MQVCVQVWACVGVTASTLREGGKCVLNKGAVLEGEDPSPILFLWCLGHPWEPSANAVPTPLLRILPCLSVPGKWKFSGLKEIEI